MKTCWFSLLTLRCFVILARQLPPCLTGSPIKRLIANKALSQPKLLGSHGVSPGVVTRAELTIAVFFEPRWVVTAGED
ncbi:MAG: hypothetical protein KIS67_02295 [Verrucomicrobiae bacterium]|nr:hypothetical protein [Verrucomicrobiae bacterium]